MAAPQLGSCASSGRAWWPRAARHSQGGPRPLGSQPRPQLLERAASKAADFTAFDYQAEGQAFKENDPHKPSNPYSASKSAAEMICQSYCNTYGVPLMVMNVMNAFGERQHPEKFIPLCIAKISKGENLTIHSYKGSKLAGSRFYFHARNIAGAVLFVLKNGKLGEKYNVQGERELDNLEVAQFVARELGVPLRYDMHDDPVSRPGHDLRYSLDGTKLKDMGWLLPLNFEESLRNTIQWTLDNPSWLDQEHFISTPGVGALAGQVMPAMKPGYNVDKAIEEGEAKVRAKL